MTSPGLLARLGLGARRGFGRFTPDPFVVAVAFTVLTIVAGAAALDGNGGFQGALRLWSAPGGLWGLLRTAAQEYPDFVAQTILSDGTSVDVGTVIWALGYRDDSSWLDIPAAVDVDRSFLHHEGRSPVGGIFFVGRPWQRNRASALIMGAGQDAERIGRAVSASRGHHVRPRIAKSSGLG